MLIIACNIIHFYAKAIIRYLNKIKNNILQSG
jgi:hypothetical protein